MYNSDKPIENFDDDTLGRQAFAKQLGKAILSLDTIDNFTIGLFGKWGTGKTSIINMAIKEIVSLSNNMSEEKTPIIMKFEPWNFADTDNLISQFFKYLRSELNLKGRNRLGEKVGEALEDYSDAIELAESIPVVGKYTTLLKLAMLFAGGQKKKKASRSNILQRKEKLAKELAKQKKKIVVIIDDIDRLSNNQIRLIFQLVNSVAGLPNVIYLLPMDKEVVVRALESVQECDGNEYLEKIIQVPFEIPQIDKSKVIDLFFHKLDEIIESKTNVIFDKEHWGKVYRGCVEPYILSIRDVNRIINFFQFKYDMVYSEVNFSDMIGVSVLQIMAPDIVKWIVEHKSELCGGTNDYTGVVMVEQQKNKQEYLKKFQEITTDAENMIKAICALFPKFEKKVEYNYESATDDELRHQLRIAHIDRFNLYFNLDISDIVISRNLVKDSTIRMTYSELEEMIKKINENENIISYLQELKSYIQDIPYERINLFIKILYNNSYYFKGTQNKLLFSISAQQYTDWCISALIKRLNSQNEKYNIYKSIIENANLNTLQTISVDINRIELSFGRLAGIGKDVDVNEQDISLEQLISLETIYSRQLKFLLRENSLFSLNNLLFIIYLWENFDAIHCSDYLLKLLEKDINVLKFIVRMSAEWTGTDGRGWTFDKKNYEEYVSTEKVINCIEKLTSTDEINEFNDEELAKLASFVLNKDKPEMEHVSEDEAMELVRKWKNLK